MTAPSHPLNHPILEQSFAVIDREIGPHSLTSAEYAIVRRIIHSTADFEFKDRVVFSAGAIEAGIEAIRQGTPIVVDVSMVRQGITSLIHRTFQNPIITAVDRAETALPGKTRTETGLLQCLAEFPTAIYVIGNAPTALLALCAHCATHCTPPALVIGVPVGFIAVLESKAALAQLSVPQIRVDGRKGGSPVASAIVNALILLAWERS
ncbi:MAG: cobalt-precorrin-8X methylmutase [Leptolyngbyaceae cyanobacterium bins.59]|nr:cobalt-precorrin-8X methylmutase [Leptolyngbyaceae cyanobacterium bins.59]